MHVFLQRPLCLFVVSYAVVVCFIQILVATPREGATSWQSDAQQSSWQSDTQQSSRQSGAQQMALTGQLYKKETKNDHLIYYLKDIQIIEVTNSKDKSKETSKQISNPNEYVANEAAQTGAICYMRHSGESDPPIGRWLYVSGEVLPFETAENDGQFDAQAYYTGLGLGLRLWDTYILSQGSTKDFFDDILVNIKNQTATVFHKYMKPENAGILCAMLLGDKTSMDAEIKNLYRKSGIAHVLAISGLHISLLGMLLYRLLRRLYLPPPLCCVLGIGIVLVYIKMVGFSVSSFRAVCMFVLYMLADLLGRTYDLLTALAFSALLLLIDNPGSMFEAGFLLSYFAVLGLALVLPVLRELLQILPRKAVLALLPGYSVQVLIFPITLWFYYEFPLYSFLLNMIVVPCMSVVLVSGIIGALPGCGAVLYVTDALLEVYEWLCRAAECLPGSVIVTGRPKMWQVVLYYVLIAAWLVGALRRRRQSEQGTVGQKDISGRLRRMFIGLFPMCCMLLFLLPVHRENRVDMLSIGQGDCICMRDSTGRVVLVDGGSTDVSQSGTYRLLPFLKYHGISEVDAVFLSHAHADHYSAIAELLESAGRDGVRIKTLCLTGYAGDVSKPEVTDNTSSAQTYAELTLLAAHAGCEIVYLNPGDRISCGKMEFDCIYPPSDISGADENDTSMVLLAELEDFSMLFTGDSSSACDDEVIRRLRARNVQTIDCLKVAHHGAQTSTSEELLEAFDFDLALISCGEGNSYGHPHSQLLSRLQSADCKVFVTAESGQVTVKIRKGRAEVATYEE